MVDRNPQPPQRHVQGIRHPILAPCEVIRFIDFWTRQHGQPPQHLVFDSQLTTYAALDRLDESGSSSSPCAAARPAC